jgi:hypothetical protein
VGFLIPNITKPVQLKLSADDVKREALGRTLGITGATVGLIGGLMVLGANPAIRAAIKRKSSVSLTMSAAQAKQDALGKVLAIIGMSVGMTGSVLTMSASPATKAKLSSHFSQLPASVRNNKMVIGGALALSATGLAYYMIRNQNKALAAQYGV